MITEAEVDREKFLSHLLVKGFESQKDFSKKTNISEAQLTNILNNKQSPTLKTLNRLCYWLECDIREIIKQVDNKIND